MALNFPIPTSVGQVYQDLTSGNTYVCTSLGPPAQWVGSGSSTSLDGTYLRKDASNDPVTGNLLLNPTTNVSPLTLQQPVGNTTPALKIENSGSGNSIEANGFAVSQTGIASFPSGTSSLPSITRSGDTNTGIYFPAADTIGLVEGGTEIVRINSSGNVGIGTTSPTSRLTVSGTTSISGNTTVTSSTASTSTTTGALVVTGGVGVGGRLNVGSEINGASILSGVKALGTTNTTITITFADYSWADISIYQNNTTITNARAYKLNAGRREISFSQNIVWQVQNDATAVWSGDNLVITIPHISGSGNTSKFCTAIGKNISNLTVI